MNKYKILFYDIETAPLASFHWGLGKQVVRHAQLVPDHSRWDIICITYCWNDGKPGKVLRYDKHGDNKGMVEAFDEIIKSAHVTIGKNSDRFDTKMINSVRMFEGVKGLPEWTMYTDDLEKQMRKHFRLPSMSLDYISDELGLGGKVKMCMQDWIDISLMRRLKPLINQFSRKEMNAIAKQIYNLSYTDIARDGKVALEKMCFYGVKDVEDTRALWYHLEQHFVPKYNAATHANNGLACVRCGSAEGLHKNGTKVSGKTRYQAFFCRLCGMYAGKAAIGVNGNLGKIG